MWLLVAWQGNQLVSVLDAQNVQHATVQLGQVVDLRSCLAQLDHGLILHQSLSHCGGVWVAHRDDIDHLEVRLACVRHTDVGLVGVVGIREVADDVLEQAELLLQAVVHPGLNSCHHLELAFQQCQCCAHWGLGRHVADLHVIRCGKATALVHNAVHQQGQHLAWLFVRQWQDVVADGARANIHVTPFAG